MLIGPVFPSQLSGSRFHRIDIPDQIAEVYERVGGEITRPPRRDDDAGTYFGRCAKQPASTAGFSVQRKHSTVMAADVNRATCQRRFGPSADGVGEGQ